VVLLGGRVGIKITKAAIFIRPYRNESPPTFFAYGQTRKSVTGRQRPVHVNARKYILTRASEMTSGRVSTPRPPQLL
jgi:hypothetical protein